MSKPYSSHAEPDQMQMVMAENERLRDALKMWIEQSYIDADGNSCTARDYAPAAYETAQSALS